MHPKLIFKKTKENNLHINNPAQTELKVLQVGLLSPLTYNV
jgi:hypothetical protein